MMNVFRFRVMFVADHQSYKQRLLLSQYDWSEKITRVRDRVALNRRRTREPRSSSSSNGLM